MGILSTLFGRGKKSSSGLFKEANRQWQTLREALLRGNDAGAQASLLEVVRLCQEAIALDPQKQGDAYVLLTNALLRGSQVYNNADEELLNRYAGACIQRWWRLPHKEWPITTRNNYEIGLRWYKEVLERLGSESAIEECGSLFGELVTSPSGLDHIKRALYPPAGQSAGEMADSNTNLM